MNEIPQESREEKIKELTDSRVALTKHAETAGRMADLADLSQDEKEKAKWKAARQIILDALNQNKSDIDALLLIESEDSKSK